MTLWSDLEEVLRGLSGERDWFAEGAIEGNPIALLSAPEKSGKSWLAIQLAVATTAAKPWLGVYPVRRWGGVVYLDGEYGESEFVRRVARVARGEGEIPSTVVSGIRYHYSAGLVLVPSSKAVRAIAADLQRRPPKLIILDPFRNHIAGSENDADAVIAAFQALTLLRDAGRCPLLVLHHLNKSGFASGSRAIAGRADLILEGSDAKVPVYAARGRTLRTHIDPIAQPFSVDIEHLDDSDDLTARTVIRACIKGEQLGPLELTLLDLLAEPRSVKWLAIEAHRNKGDIKAALGSLQARGAVQAVPAELRGQMFTAYVRKSK